MPNEIKFIERDEKTGLIKGRAYIFDENGFVDWRKEIDDKFLVANSQKTQETDISKLKDSELLILLGGIKQLSQLRGYYSVDYKRYHASETMVSVGCVISWIPNYETEGRVITYESLGDATYSNTDGFGRNFLSAIAENRAFVRSVRNFLRINIISKEEIPSTKFEESPAESHIISSPTETLKSLMTTANVSMTMLVNSMKKNGVENAERFIETEDIPIPLVFEYIERIQAKINKKP